MTIRPSGHVFYLHGFASSGHSTKAAYFADRLRQHGMLLRCPDFNEPDFGSLTMTRMLDLLAADVLTLGPPAAGPPERGPSASRGTGNTVPADHGSTIPDAGTPAQQPIVLIGSSLGAIVALHTAARMPDRIDRLVLLAPALTFPRGADEILGAEQVDRWRATGTIDLYHHGYGGMRSLSYRFYEDGLKYDAFKAEVTQPILIFQGTRDAAVDHRVVQQYAAARPNVRLTLLDDDHRLVESLPSIWRETAAFLELT